MSFWQENYQFIKEVYEMRHSKMAEWMENVEKAIGRIMADKVYTSAEFKRERDTFNSLCKDLERTEVKKWLAQILEILMAERAKDQKKTEGDKLDALIQKHEELIPSVQKTAVMVDLYWKCYAYGDELKPHVEFLDGIMLSSTRDIAPSCVENVDELIERQEKSLVQLDTKRNVVNDLIEKGRKILENPDKPKFLEKHVSQIEDGWDLTKTKAQERLKLLNDTKEAWIGYAENNDVIATEIEKGIEEIKKVKKKYNLESAFDDLAKRQKIFNDTKNSIMGLFQQIQHNVEVMSLTIPEDKKKIIVKEVAALQEKLVVVEQYKEKVDIIDKFCNELKSFDGNLKTVDAWMMGATKELEEIKNASDKMAPEDRVARTMDLQEDIAAKVIIIKANIETELALLPQGEKVPQDAQEHKDELNRITKYVTDLQNKVKKECDNFSEDVKYWAEYKTGIKEFTPWLVSAESSFTEGLAKPSSLGEAQELSEKVHGFEKSCADHLKVLDAANEAAIKMTTHKDADAEVIAMKERYAKIKAVADNWVKKVDTLVKEWALLDNTVTELNAWVAKDKTQEGENQFSLEKMESTLGELKSIFKQKEKLVEQL
eukprot:TRINITY_DN891_c0_g1_i7.p1 TRINITY_DN891_c0_g1~~TRINITY_DN891_c0_g1_i7.p1  ORF type:complete len:600 (+),score=224.52 TRINITY_DN891_c0_g1_i7:50-1849(+)